MAEIPSCPKCDKPMVLQTAQKGPNKGNQFWGCSDYRGSGCKGTRVFEGSAIPSCPKCDKPMVLRTARKGKNEGNQFWGCSDFLSSGCKGTRDFEGPAKPPKKRPAKAKRICKPIKPKKTPAEIEKAQKIMQNRDERYARRKPEIDKEMRKISERTKVGDSPGVKDKIQSQLQKRFIEESLGNRESFKKDRGSWQGKKS